MLNSTNMRGAALMTGSMAAFTVNDTFVKLLGESLPFFQFLVLRSVGAAVLMLLLAWKAGVLRLPPSPRDRRLMLPSLCSGLGMGGMFAYISGSPFVLIGHYDVSETRYGLLFGLNAFGLILSSQLNGHWLRRRHPEAVMRYAIWVPAAAGLALLTMNLGGPPPLALLMCGLFAYVSVLGCIMPNAGAVAMAEQGRVAGAASAVMGCTSYLIGMAAGLAVSLIATGGVLPMVSVMAACGVLSTVAGWASLRRPRVLPAPPVEPDPPPA